MNPLIAIEISQLIAIMSGMMVISYFIYKKYYIQNK